MMTTVLPWMVVSMDGIAVMAIAIHSDGGHCNDAEEGGDHIVIAAAIGALRR